MQRTSLTLALAAAVAVAPHTARAQLSGEHALIAFGLKSGTQPPPGFYLFPTYYNWSVDHIRGAAGRRIDIAGFNVDAVSLLGWFVSPAKLLGADYAFMFNVPMLSNSLELPRLGFSSSTTLGMGDLYVQPINLGWHKPRADFMTGLAFYAPTGNYTPNGDDNHGLGMTTYELSAGTTVYFDSAQTWHASTLGFFETHSKKRGLDLRAGNLLTFEGGVGGSFLKSALITGLVYGAQWKVSDDHGVPLPAAVPVARSRIYTLGPEVTYTPYLKPPWMGSLTARYLWDTGARFSFEGQRFTIFATLAHLRMP